MSYFTNIWWKASAVRSYTEHYWLNIVWMLYRENNRICDLCWYNCKFRFAKRSIHSGSAVRGLWVKNYFINVLVVYYLTCPWALGWGEGVQSSFKYSAKRRLAWARDLIKNMIVSRVVLSLNVTLSASALYRNKDNF